MLEESYMYALKCLLFDTTKGGLLIQVVTIQVVLYLDARLSQHHLIRNGISILSVYSHKINNC